MASDAYALRWCLFHMKRSSAEGEAVAVACSLSYVRKRSAGDIVSFVADLNVLQGQDTLLLSDSLVLSRNLLSRGLPLVEQLWQRLTPRADADGLLPRDAGQRRKACREQATVFNRAPDGSDGGGWGGAVPDRGLMLNAVAAFVDPATGEPRVACAYEYDKKANVYDPVAGGAALVVLEVGGFVEALAVFKDPATGEPRLGLCSGQAGAHIRPGRGWRCAAWDRRGLEGVFVGGLCGSGDGGTAARL